MKIVFEESDINTAQQLAASLAKKASGGSSGRSSKGSSKKSSSTSSDLAKYVEDAKRLIESKDGHGRTNYSIAQVIEYVADQYPSLTDSQIKKVITQAGGDYDKGLRILKQVTDTDK